MSAAAFASYVYSKLSGSGPLNISSTSDMSSPSKNASSTPKLTAVWRTKPSGFEEIVSSTSNFKEDGSLLKMLRTKSMPSLLLERNSTVKYPAAIVTPPSSTRFDNSFNHSPASSLNTPIKSKHVNPPRKLDESYGFDSSTTNSISTPPPSPSAISPLSSRKLQRSASDGHILQKRKKSKDSFELPLTSMPSVKSLRRIFDDGSAPRTLEPLDKTPTISMKSSSRKKSESEVNRNDKEATSMYEGIADIQYSNLDQKLVGGEILKTAASHHRQHQPPAKIHPPLSSVKNLSQHFELSELPNIEGETAVTTLKPVIKGVTSERVVFHSHTPEKSIATEPRRRRHADSSYIRQRAKSEPPSRRESLKHIPVSVSKLRMQFERQKESASTSSPILKPVKQENNRLGTESFAKGRNLFETNAELKPQKKSEVQEMHTQNKLELCKTDGDKPQVGQSLVNKEPSVSDTVNYDLTKTEGSKMEVLNQEFGTPSVKSLRKQFEQQTVSETYLKKTRNEILVQRQTSTRSLCESDMVINTAKSTLDMNDTDCNGGEVEIKSTSAVKALLQQFELQSPTTNNSLEKEVRDMFTFKPANKNDTIIAKGKTPRVIYTTTRVSSRDETIESMISKFENHESDKEFYDSDSDSVDEGTKSRKQNKSMGKVRRPFVKTQAEIHFSDSSSGEAEVGDREHIRLLDNSKQELERGREAKAEKQIPTAAKENKLTKKTAGHNHKLIHAESKSSEDEHSESSRETSDSEDDGQQYLQHKNIEWEKAEEERNTWERAGHEILAWENADQEIITKEMVEQECKPTKMLPKSSEDSSNSSDTEEQNLEKQKSIQERIEREKAEHERIAKEEAEHERIAKEKAEHERIAKEKAEHERIAKEKVEQERIAKETAEKNLIAKAMAEKKQEAKKKKLFHSSASSSDSSDSEEEEKYMKVQQKGAEESVTQEKAEQERIAKEKTEQERIAKEKAEQERIAKEKAEQEQITKEKAEQERIAKEKAEEERIAKEKAEQERIAKEKAEQERIAKEKAEQERIAKEKAEQERIAKEKAEQERIAKEKAEQERIAKEKAEQERIAKEKAEQERIAKEKAEQERIAKEKAEQERIAKEKAEQERIAKEKAEQERIAKEKAEQEQIAKEKAEQEQIAKEKAKQERIAMEKAEQERIAKEKFEQERIAKEKAEQEQEAKKIKDQSSESSSESSESEEEGNFMKANVEAEDCIAREKAEQERIAMEKAEQERIAKEKAEQERIAKEKAEQERIAKEKAEQERIAKEKAEQERIAKEKAEQERVAKEKAEQERIAKEKAEQERIAKEKAEQERIAKEKAEQDRIAQEKAEQDRIAQEKAEQARIAQEKAEQARIAQEKAEQARIAQEKAEQARIAQEKAEQARIAQEKAEQARIAQEKAEQARIAQENSEQAQIAQEKAEQARIAQEKAEQEQEAKKIKDKSSESSSESSDSEEEDKFLKANEEAEKDRIAREKAEQSRIANEKAEQERIARKKAEQERITREMAEQERITREKAEQERITREKAEQERITREKAEQERIAREKAKQEPVSKNKAEQEFSASEKTRGKKKPSSDCSSDSSDNEFTAGRNWTTKHHAPEKIKKEKDRSHKLGVEFDSSERERKDKERAEKERSDREKETEELQKEQIVGKLIGKFSTAQEPDVVPRSRNDSVGSDERGSEDKQDSKVSQLLEKFVNSKEVDFEDDRLDEENSRFQKGRRDSDVAKLIGMFSNMNKRRSSSSSESDDDTTADSSVKKYRDGAPAPTKSTANISGKVRNLNPDELRMFNQGGVALDPFVRSQSLRVKKNEPSFQIRGGSLRVKKSEPHPMSDTAKAMPKSCRQLRPDELRFFRGNHSNIYITKSDVSKQTPENSSPVFRLSSQGNLKNKEQRRFPGGNSNQCDPYSSDSDSNSSILRDDDLGQESSDEALLLADGIGAHVTKLHADTDGEDDEAHQSMLEVHSPVKDIINEPTTKITAGELFVPFPYNDEHLKHDLSLSPEVGQSLCFKVSELLQNSDEICTTYEGSSSAHEENELQFHHYENPSHSDIMNKTFTIYEDNKICDIVNDHAFPEKAKLETNKEYECSKKPLAYGEKNLVPQEHSLQSLTEIGKETTVPYEDRSHKKPIEDYYLELDESKEYLSDKEFAAFCFLVGGLSIAMYFIYAIFTFGS